jgi:DNA-directed RNA polymerase III subunit RPC8
MYVLAEMKDTVHVKPWLFDKDLRSVIEDELNTKFANKVVFELGLCVALYDIKSIADSYVLPGDGSSHTRVEFRYVIFRPFIDEVLIGRVRSCSEEGIYVSLTFFDDIFIPKDNLQKPYRYDESKQLFVWEYDAEIDLYIEIGETIRFLIL